MQLLLMSKQEVASGEAPSALWALEWLFFGVRPLMSLQVLESRK